MKNSEQSADEHGLDRILSPRSIVLVRDAHFRVRQESIEDERPYQSTGARDGREPGLGRAIVEALAQRGARVTVLARDSDALAAAVLWQAADATLSPGEPVPTAQLGIHLRAQ